jgi:hypothetical protein
VLPLTYAEIKITRNGEFLALIRNITKPEESKTAKTLSETAQALIRRERKPRQEAETTIGTIRKLGKKQGGKTSLKSRSSTAKAESGLHPIQSITTRSPHG